MHQKDIFRTCSTLSRSYLKAWDATFRMYFSGCSRTFDSQERDPPPAGGIWARSSPWAGACSASWLLLLSLHTHGSRHAELQLLAAPRTAYGCNRVAANTYSVFMLNNFRQGEFNASIAYTAHKVKLIRTSIK